MTTVMPVSKDSLLEVVLVVTAQSSALNEKPELEIFTQQKISTKSKPKPKSDYSIGYIPALDGLRAFSILLVMFFHDIGPVTSNYGHYLNGWIGVDVFFVISGFLITSILLKESKDTGTFSLKNFYVRRWLRIAPAYYAFIGVVLAWTIWGGNHHLKPFIAAALYLTNLDLAFSWNLIPLKLGMSHLWSLAVEEQFYLFWPAMLKGLKQHATKVVLATIAAVYCWKLLLVSRGADWVRICHGFDTRLDVLMYGALIALVISNPSWRGAAAKVLGNGWAQTALLIAMITGFHLLGHPGQQPAMFFWSVKMPLVISTVAAFITSILLAPRALVSVILSNPLFVWLGKLSYSLYLWHPLVHSIYCAFYWDYFCKHGPKAELYQYGWILAVSALSYYAIERPFLSLKSKFSSH